MYFKFENKDELQKKHEELVHTLISVIFVVISLCHLHVPVETKSAISILSILFENEEELTSFFSKVYIIWL